MLAPRLQPPGLRRLSLSDEVVNVDKELAGGCLRSLPVRSAPKPTRAAPFPRLDMLVFKWAFGTMSTPAMLKGKCSSRERHDAIRSLYTSGIRSP